MSLFDKIFKKQEASGAGTDDRARAEGTERIDGDAVALTPSSDAAVAKVNAEMAKPLPPVVGKTGDVARVIAELGEQTSRNEEQAAPLHKAEVLAFPVRTASAAVDVTVEEPLDPTEMRGAQALEMPAPGQPQTVEQMRQDPNYVRVFDPYGQEIFVPRQQWRDEVLPGNLQAAANNPDELYAVLLNAMNDGFFAEIEPAAAHLQAIDTNTVRGACIYAIVLLQLGRQEEAERVLRTELEKHGEDAAVLTNLSRILATRGEREPAKAMLWRAIELDPNLENALGWYLALEQERGGEEQRRSAMDRIAALPGSWRVRLWRAKMALDAQDLPGAIALYREGLKSFPGPVPTEFLYPMSGDLGMNGRLRELIDMTEPYFLPEVHGLPVGNNLIKAHFDLGELEPAAAITQRLFAMKRPDWREPLGFWEQTIGRALRAQQPQMQQEGPLEIGMLEMSGPVWRRAGGPLEEAFGGAKPAGAPVVTILGGTADLPNVQGEVAMQVADAVGRLSRAMPLFLAEQVEFHTAAQARTLLPRVTQGGGGFVLRGSEWADAEAVELAREGELAPELIVRAHVDARAQPWVAVARVMRATDGVELGAVRAEFPAGQPEYGMPALASALERLLEQQGIGSQAAPAAYQVPETSALANYLLRLEQLLALRSAVTLTGETMPMSGEREILEGNLGLALQQPGNATVRALLASTVATLWRLRPQVAEEFEDRLELLARDRPVGEPVNSITLAMMTD